MSKPRAKNPLRSPWGSHFLYTLAAFCVTLLVSPANAGISLPTDPLTTGARVPPNILFILDNSGSMDRDYMPDSVPVVAPSAIQARTYARNAIYYNPALTYQPWTLPDGTLMTGGQDYTTAYSDLRFVPYTGVGPGGVGTISTSSGTVNLLDAVQTFYVPQDTSRTDDAYLGDTANYYRYQILQNGAIYRSEYLVYTSSNTPVDSGNSDGGTLGPATGSVNASNFHGTTWSFNVPANASNLVIKTQGGSVNSGVRGADLYVRRGNNPTTGNYTERSINDGNSEIVSLASLGTTAASTWYVRLYAQSAFTGPVTITYSYDYTTTDNTAVAAMGCSTNKNATTLAWRNCTQVTPTGRTEVQERANFATWYSYHRTRYKAAKAGASAAFASLGSDIRVGFRVIGSNGANDSPINTAANRNLPTYAVPIPVAYNDGLFSDTGTTSQPNAYNNRTQWFNRLFGAYGGNATPLRGALRAAGQYFQNSTTSGPYGPAAAADQLACRQNFTILTTDGFWNETFADNTIGDADGTTGPQVSNPDGTPAYQYSPVAPYMSGTAWDGSPTLADVAMYYWRTDLRSDLDNLVPTSGSNPAFWQHMVTFAIGLGVAGTVDQNSVDEVLANGNATYRDGNNNTINGWPTPENNHATGVSDLLHAAVNGRGTYVAANNPTEFERGLKAALAAVIERTGSFSNVENNSEALNTGSRLFQATYVSGTWTGDVAAYPISSAGVNTVPVWRAKDGIPTVNRKLFTTAGAFPASATTAQLNALERTGVTNYPVSGARNAAYIAGERNHEIANGGTLRNRNHVLGDIVGSSPAYVSSTNTLYVGANDGMLHAIDGGTGTELFGFVPNGINWSDLGTLSRPDYSHRYFVDGPIVVSTKEQTPNKNLLVAGLGKGGKGFFVLDVTNPAGFDQSKFKWEITGTENDMGLVQSRPIIAKLNNGITALIVSNGINSTNGHAVLLIYNLETGALIKKINTNVGSPIADHADSNGLSAPAGWDADGNGTLDYLYAGDMLGNVWKFDLSAASSSSWAIANSSQPIFKATYTKADGSVVRQPITGGLTLAMHPTNYKTWVFFGTGRLMTAGDMQNKDVQSMYGFVDDGSTLVRGGNLTKRITVVSGVINGRAVRTFQEREQLPASSKGWYVDLLTPPGYVPEGERVVTTAQVMGGRRETALLTASAIPTASACHSDGRGFLNALDAFTGTSLTSSFFDVNSNGKFTDEVLNATRPDGSSTQIPVGSVDMGVGMPTMPNLMGNPDEDSCLISVTGSNGQVRTIPCRDVRNLGRVSWREIKRGN